MKGLLLKLFRCRSEQAPATEVASASAPAQKPAPRKPAGKRRHGKGKRHHHAPRGAYKADWNEPILRGDRR